MNYIGLIKSFLAICISISLNSQVINQTKSESQYQISNIYDIRQKINPNGYTYFATPFWKDYVFELQETKNYVITCFTNQITVFDKKNKFWQLFTMSDGYQPVRSPIRFTQNYENYFVISGTSYTSNSDTSNIVNVFDKVNFKVFAITADEYKIQSKKWTVEKFVKDEKNKWDAEDSYPVKIIHDDKRLLQKSYFTYRISGLNNIKEIKSNNNYCVVAQHYGLRIIDKNGTIKLFNSSYGLYNDNINSVKIFNDKLLILYDSIIDIFQIGDFSRLKRLPITSENSNVILNDTLLIYSTDSVLVTMNFEDNSVVDSIFFSTIIQRIVYNHPYVLLHTDVGFSSYNLQTKEAKNLLNNGLKLESEQSNEDLRCSSFECYYWIGKIRNTIIGIKQQNDFGAIPIHETILFNLPLNQIVKNPDSVIPQNMQELMNKSFSLYRNSIFLSDNFMLLENNGKYSIFKIETKNIPYSFELQLEFMLEQINEFQYLPNVFKANIEYPIGSKITSLEAFDDKLWIGTNKGLFSIDSMNKWVSYFEKSSKIGYSKDLMVSDEGIYTCNTDRQISMDWSRIDRNNYQLSHLDNFYCWPIWEGGYTVKDNKMIAATNNGLLSFDFITKEYELTTTPEVIKQVAFFEDHYITASDSNIFEFDKNKNLINTYLLKQDKPVYRSGYLPFSMDVDGRNIWFGSYLSGMRSNLTMYNLDSRLRFDFPTYDSKDIRTVIPDKKDVWIFGSDFIYRFNRKTSSLHCLGRISYPARGRTEIKDACENDSLIYLTTNRGIYELNKENLTFRLSNIPVFSRHFPGDIVRRDNLYFIQLAGGVLQMENDEFEESFSENKDVKLFHKEWEDIGIIIPRSSDSVIYINDRTKDHFYYINFENDIRENKLKIYRFRSILNFKVYVDNIELELKYYLENQKNSLKNTFKIIIPSGLLNTLSDTDLNIYYVVESEKVLLRSFKLKIE